MNSYLLTELEELDKAPGPPKGVTSKFSPEIDIIESPIESKIKEPEMCPEIPLRCLRLNF
jgi:hypothetical protein